VTENRDDGCPRRMVCLTGATREVLDRLGAGDRVVGMGAGVPGSPEALEALRVRGFKEADPEQILLLKPDLVLASSDLQADLARELSRLGIPVMSFTLGSVEEILRMIRLLGGRVGLQEKGLALAADLEKEVQEVRERGENLLRRPRVFFEEWPDPLISCSGWVSELIEAAGGEDVFPEHRARHEERGRIVDPAEVARREPEVVIGSWRGEKVDFGRIRSRPGWERVPALRRGKLFEIDSALILQPGPAALTAGLARLHEILAESSLG